MAGKGYVVGGCGAWGRRRESGMTLPAGLGETGSGGVSGRAAERWGGWQVLGGDGVQLVAGV